MRTRKSAVTFNKPFVLNADVGELPPGTYDVETDEEEIGAGEYTGHRRTAVVLYVRQGGSTRSIFATPKELDSALERDKDA
ncbi:hypothetical protein LZ016_14775 [Sphingomonas sp. SM33]|jgi:hypothetical protein|uniref:Uncharacterized protein n=1 Tax=Sphingomonas telluris TaxID=2907998 RepID=A0ABS9VQW9_9SPHN|nr:hypothetical protein [Sphingomonas telluris]MCH8617360.1 hypothetical protein [Sphingomonas telluris]